MGFAKGKYAKAISDRSGMEFPYNEMMREWNGSLVHKSEFETKHPQLTPSTKGGDNEALKDASPSRSEPMTVFLGGVGFFSQNNTMKPQTKKPPIIVPMIGNVTVSIS